MSTRSRRPSTRCGRWRRRFDLDDEIADHDRLLDELTADASPTLRDGYGIGADTVAEMLIVFGGNPERVRSEAAFAKLGGARPIEASTGVTNKHRHDRGGHRQANAALYRTVIVPERMSSVAVS